MEASRITWLFSLLDLRSHSRLIFLDNVLTVSRRLFVVQRDHEELHDYRINVRALRTSTKY